jgi:hypothetical protein
MKRKEDGDTLAAGRLWSSLAVGCAGMMAVLLLAVAGYLAWANRLPPPPASGAPLPVPNGFDAAVAAAFRLRPPGPEFRSWDAVYRLSPAALEAEVAPNRRALAELRASFELEYRTPPVRDPGQPQPHLPRLRHGARLLAAESRLAREGGMSRAALDHALDAFELGVRVGTGGGVLHQITAAGCVWTAMGQAEAAIDGLTGEEAAHAERRLARMIARLPRDEDVLEAERGIALATARRVFRTAEPMPAPSGVPTQGWFREAWDATAHVFYPKSWSYDALDRYFDRLIEESRKPYAQRRYVPPPGDPIGAGLAENFSGLGYNTLRLRTALMLFRLELALHAFHARHGIYPEKLDALEPVAERSARLDPYSGEGFRYRPQKPAYLLYSVGPDLRDDGGMPIQQRAFGPSARGDLTAGRLSRRHQRFPGLAPIVVSGGAQAGAP